jgi:U3 small nucleolar RNA-associated protein 18
MTKPKKSQTTTSPLNSSVQKSIVDSKKEGRTGKKQTSRRGDMTAEKLAEEAALTALLFGGGSAAVDMDIHHASYSEPSPRELGGSEHEHAGDLLFVIDRSGVEVDEEGIAAGAYNSEHEDESEDDNDSTDGEDGQQVVSMRGAAWQDDDESDGEGDDSKNVSLVNGPNRIKKLRRYRDETDPISIKEYELRLRERFVNTASVAARTDWADVANATEDDGDRKRLKTSDSDDSEQSDEEEGQQFSSVNRILQSNASLFATSSSSLPLPPTILDIYRVRDGNIADPSKSCVNALQFHPSVGRDYDGSKDCSDRPLLMTAGMDKMLRFFRIDGETNEKVHGLFFDDMPIMCASFLGDSGSVVMSGRRPFFYVYDAASGNVVRYHAADFGSRERSLEKFAVSSDGKVIAFLGNDGYIILLDGVTRRWIGDLKMNGSVRAIAFSSDGEYIMGSGSDGDVYKWSVKSRRCVERFHNEDGTITSSMAVSNDRDMLAVGAESGVVNLYDNMVSSSFPRSASMMERTPIKSIMNLSTTADLVKFSGDGQILAMSTRREKNGLKLLHVPTSTVFSNWPTSKTPLKYVWSLDFSPGSKYFCAGTDHGKCLLYQLKHFWSD